MRRDWIDLEKVMGDLMRMYQIIMGINWIEISTFLSIIIFFYNTRTLVYVRCKRFRRDIRKDCFFIQRLLGIWYILPVVEAETLTTFEKYLQQHMDDQSQGPSATKWD